MPRPLRLLLPVVVVAVASATAVQVQAAPAAAPASAATPAAADPSPRTATYSTFGTRSVPSPDGKVLVKYPTSSGRMAADRPLVIVGHGHGMNPAVALEGNSYLARAGYVVAVPPLGASHDFHALAGVVSRSLDAVLADRVLAPGIMEERIGYTGASMGAITGIALLDPRVRDRRIDALVIRSGSRAGMRPSWDDAPPLLFVLGTDDKVISPDKSRKAYDAATFPKGKIELPGAGHNLQEPTRTPIVSDSTVAFFSRFLNGVDNGLDGIRAAVDRDPNRPSYVHEWALDRSGGTPGTTPTYSLERSGALESGARRSTYEIDVTRSRLRARLSFAIPGVARKAERAVMTLRDADGDLVERSRGDSVLRLRADVREGTYRLTVRKAVKHRERALDFDLEVAPAG
jgi:dienelactone hydrolase